MGGARLSGRSKSRRSKGGWGEERWRPKTGELSMKEASTKSS